jgi:hypothetical protein
MICNGHGGVALENLALRQQLASLKFLRRIREDAAERQGGDKQ